MEALAVIFVIAALVVVVSRTEVGEWLAWNASFHFGREQAERRALYRLQLKLALLKSLVRAIARAEQRLARLGSRARHTRR